MQSTIEYRGGMKFAADNHRGHITMFDSNAEGAENSAATPMEVMLQTIAACTGIDIVLVMGKKRRTIMDFKIEIQGKRRDNHPRIFTDVEIKYILDSPNATEKEFLRAIELSQDKYCGASAVVKLSGCDVRWTYELRNTPA
jgi:putative redox protein